MHKLSQLSNLTSILEVLVYASVDDKKGCTCTTKCSNESPQNTIHSMHLVWWLSICEQKTLSD